MASGTGSIRNPPRPPTGGLRLGDLRGWRLAVADDAPPAERYAAEEFREFFRQASGTLLAPAPPDAPPVRLIAIGHQAARRFGGDSWAPEGFGEEESRLRIAPAILIVAGGLPRGTLYGVYGFLEDCLGVRFLASDATHVPPLDDERILAAADRRHRPRFAFRWPYSYGTNNDPVLATRQRTNTVQTRLEALQRPFMRKPPVAQDGRPFRNADPCFGGVSPLGLVGHSFYELLPPAAYAAEHPEYYFERNGRRAAPEDLRSIENWQPCLAHPEVLRIVTGKILDQLAADPALKFVTVSQNDGGNHCQCAACRALDEREGTPMGSLLAFVNRVADAVARVRPEALVGTLAYGYSWQPPRTLRAHPNVYIQLCTFQCCTLHALDDPGCPRNAPFLEHLAGWRRSARHIGIWNYQANFTSYLSPFPSLPALQGTLRLLAANPVDAVFLQSVYDTPGGDMAELRNYLMAALLWDPARDLRTWRDEFLDLYYGRAAPPIRRFLDALQERVSARNLHPVCYGFNKDFGLDGELVLLGLRCFDEAEARADGACVRARVEKASLCALRAAIEPALRAREPLPPDERARLEPLVQRFFDRCRNAGVLKLRECRVDEWRPVAAEIRQIERIREQVRTCAGIEPGPATGAMRTCGATAGSMIHQP